MVLQYAIGRQPNGVFDPFAFEVAVDLGIGEAGVGPEIKARDFAAIARQDRLQNALPAIGAVHVAGQGAAFQIAERMIAGAFVMAVPDAQLLFAMLTLESISRRRLRAGGGHEPCRSIGRTDRRVRRGSSQPSAIASRSGPSGLRAPRILKPPCRRREWPPEQEQLIILGELIILQSWDTANKGSPENDFSVCTTWVGPAKAMVSDRRLAEAGRLPRVENGPSKPGRKAQSQTNPRRGRRDRDLACSRAT